MSEEAWMPIETAPKDGTLLLVCSVLSSSQSAMAVAHWDQSHWFALFDEKLREAPTHWMPLPAPPTPKEPHA